MSRQMHITAEDAGKQLKAVQQHKKDPDRVLEPLEVMCMSLVMGVEGYLRAFDAAAAISMLVRMTRRELFAFSGDATTMIFRALSLIMEYVPGSYESALPFHKQLMKTVCRLVSRTLAGSMKYNNTDNAMLLEESLRLIRFISRDEYSISILRLGVPDIIGIAVSENTLLARQALEALLVICSKVVFLPGSSNLFSFNIPVFCGGEQKKRRNEPGSFLNENPMVLVVEKVIVPSLHMAILQYAASLESFPDSWSCLEIAMQCLGRLIQRAMLFRCNARAKRMVSRELCQTLFRLLAFNDRNVALEHSVRSERVLLCETLLSSVIAADWTVASDSLLSDDAQLFYRLVFADSDAEGTSQLENPFLIGRAPSGTSQRGDKEHIISISALRLFILACPRVRREAFGPKPEFALPVHQWMWEDDMRHMNRIIERACIGLEMSLARQSKEAWVRTNTKALKVDLRTMKISGGFGTTDCNVSRKFVPFVFHFVDEADLYLEAIKKGEKRSKMRRSGILGAVNQPSSASSASGTAEATLSHLNGLCTMNTDVFVPSSYIGIAEVYLESLCNYTLSASCEMTVQLGTCACASILQAAIRCGEEQRLSNLLFKVMQPLCEMLREVFISADKTTKSMALSMIVWLLGHSRASEWKFVEMAHKCGVIRQLEILSRSHKNNNNSNVDRSRGVSTHCKRSDHVSSILYVFGARQSRTEHVASMASLLLYVMDRQLENKTLVGGHIALHAVQMEDVLRAVNQLKACVAVPGVHRAVLVHMLNVIEKSVGTIASFEASNLGIADAMLFYLLGSKNTDVRAKGKSSKSNQTKADAHARKPPSVASFPAVGTAADMRMFDGTRVADRLHRECRKDRLECFLQCAIERPHVVGALIEILIGTLSLKKKLPLVESLLSSQVVSCRTPQKAALACMDIPLTVALCSKQAGDDNDGVGIPTDHALYFKDKTNQRPPRGSEDEEDAKQKQSRLHLKHEQVTKLETAKPSQRECCPKGHRLHTVFRPPHRLICTVCGEDLHSGFFCDQCEYYLCKDCSAKHETQQGGGDAGLSPASKASGANVAPAAGDRQKRPQAQSISIFRTHLFSSIGDMERCFRTGSSSTKGTSVAPAPPSALQNVDRFMERVGYVMAREKGKYKFSALRHRVQRALNTFAVRSSVPDSMATAQKQQQVAQASRLEESTLERLLCDAMEERYILYTNSTGRCAYQETLIASLIQRALCDGCISVVEQLESCLLIHEESAEGTVPAESLLDVCKRPAASSSVQTGTLDKGIAGQTYVFHHFQSDEETHCCCGEGSREDLNTMHAPNMVRKPPQLSQSSDMLLLILLHKLLHPLIRQGSIDIDTSAFLSTHFTTLVIKSLAASALRVALLPPRLAVPRWVDFILVEANFLLPLSVRGCVARFFACGARRALHNHLRNANVIRDCKSIDVYPAEWARGANHKYTVSRSTLLRDAYKVLQKCADSRFPVSIEFEEDVGVGQGPTAHFYTLIAQKVAEAEFMLWRGNEHVNLGGYAESRSDSRDGRKTGDPVVFPRGAEGLYPRAMESKLSLWACPASPKLMPGGGRCFSDHISALCNFAMFDRKRANCYYLVGAALGRAFLDKVVFPLDLNPALAIFLIRGVPAPRVLLYDGMGSDVVDRAERPIDLMGLSLEDLELMDRSISTSLSLLHSLDAAALESLDLPFTLPGNDAFEMTRGGAEMHVSAGNVSRYICRVVSALLYESVILPIRFMVYGFRDVVPCEALVSLDAREAMDTLCGTRVKDGEPLWTLEEIKSILLADHGYQSDSPQIIMLQNILANRMTPKEQRMFLLFSTGCPRLPVGGVQALGGITVVKSSLMTVFSAGGDGVGQQLLGEMTHETTSPSHWESAWPLPSVNTCFRYLKLPPYPTEELMYKKLLLSITQGGETFELS